MVAGAPIATLGGSMTIGHLWNNLGIVALAMAAGCGGKVDDAGEEPSPAAPIDSPDPPANQNETPPKQNGASPGTTALGECELGFELRKQPSRRCDWVVEGRCYGDKLSACACACPPNSQNTFCTSEFPSRNFSRMLQKGRYEKALGPQENSAKATQVGSPARHSRRASPTKGRA